MPGRSTEVTTRRHWPTTICLIAQAGTAAGQEGQSRTLCAPGVRPWSVGSTAETT